MPLHCAGGAKFQDMTFKPLAAPRWDDDRAGGLQPHSLRHTCTTPGWLHSSELDDTILPRNTPDLHPYPVVRPLSARPCLLQLGGIFHHPSHQPLVINPAAPTDVMASGDFKLSAALRGHEEDVRIKLSVSDPSAEKHLEVTLSRVLLAWRASTRLSSS